MLQQATLPGMPNVTSSPGSGAGHTRCASPAGQMALPYGQAPAPASLSALPGEDSGPKTRVTFGRSFAVSSASAALQSSLANRLQAKMGVDGSPEYSLTWKSWTMPLQAPICALRASPRRTSDKDFTGWGTPCVGDSETMNPGGQVTSIRRQVMELTGWGTPRITTNGGIPCPEHTGNGSRLEDQAALTGWVSPTAQDGTRGGKPARPQDTGVPLSQQVALVGWSTPRSEDSEQTGAHRGNPDTLNSQAKLAGWPTCAARDWRDGRSNQHEKNARPLNEVVMLVGWQTPNALDGGQTSRSGERKDELPLGGQCRGMITTSPPDTNPSAEPCSAVYRLNPCFSLWLMGFPVAEWVSCGVRAMLSCRKLRRRSSKRTGKREAND